MNGNKQDNEIYDEPLRMRPDRLEQINEHLRTFGPANCWTGTTGELCRMMFELLAEREILLMQLEGRVRNAIDETA